MNSVEVIELKPKKQPISITLQIIFVIAVLISGIASLFIKELMPLLYAMLSLTLFTMAWNQYKISKKKKVAILYAVFGIITLVSAIWELLWLMKQYI